MRSELNATDRAAALEVPAGERSERRIPDSLELTDRARLALRGIAGSIDERLRYHMYFFVHWDCRTPYRIHHGADSTCDPLFAETLAMLRTMSGSEEHLDIETGQWAELLSRIDGDLYWNYSDPLRPWGNSYMYAHFDGERRAEDVANVAGNGMLLRALLTRRELLGDSSLDGYLQRLVRGLRRIAIHQRDYSYYPDGGFGEPFNFPRSGWVSTREPLAETEGGEGSVTSYQATPLSGLVRWYQASGDTQALDLAGRLARFCMKRRFWGGVADPHGDFAGLPIQIATSLPDPACVAGAELGHWFSHGHARAWTLRALLDYGAATGDERVLEFVRRGYEYTLTMGIPRIGWYNVFPGRLNFTEGCMLGDMVALGIRLSDYGVGDYWDDVDAVVRNHLCEQQVLDADALRGVAAASPAERREQDRTGIPHQYSMEQVIERSLGIFAGISLPDCIPEGWVWSMQCCTGTAAQGLYYAWEGAVRENGDSATVNLLLNRVAAGLEVASHLPFSGKVIIRNRSKRRIAVRIPCWARHHRIVALVSGREVSPRWLGAYLMFESLKPGDEISIRFPIHETIASYTVNSRTEMEQRYTCTFRGSTLVDIDPRDERPASYPLYRRSHLRRDDAPMKDATGFVPRKHIVRW